jgi:hypothetical protein
MFLIKTPFGSQDSLAVRPPVKIAAPQIIEHAHQDLPLAGGYQQARVGGKFRCRSRAP